MPEQFSCILLRIALLVGVLEEVTFTLMLALLQNLQTTSCGVLWNAFYMGKGKW
jgi:hypothetical protein